MGKLIFLVLILMSGLASQQEWKAPDYSCQNEALGYSKDAFSVPENLRQRVDFWIDIYSKYSTAEGLLHDARYLDIVYQRIDFQDIEEDVLISRSWKEVYKQRRVRDAKNKIKKLLLSLASVKDPAQLNEDELRIWKLFEGVDEQNKFTQAAKRSRLRFQLGQSDQIKRGIFYSGRYLAQMEQIFRDNGLPVELTRLPFVESSFNTNARSKVGASGIWQFMRSTSRYRLRIDDSVDERNDPILSTIAAANFLRYSYSQVESWPLAVTGYNHGPAGMRRMAEKHGTKDLHQLIWNAKKSSFGFASQNFWACFLAVLHVEANADKYFANLMLDRSFERHQVQLPRELSWRDFVRLFDNDSKMARLYNPHIRHNIYALNRRTRLFIPPERQELYASLWEMKKKDVRVVKVEKKEESLLNELGRILGTSSDEKLHPQQLFIASEEILPVVL